ncbi:MAG: hypothetical protein DRI28_03670, partial [Caldiserica bacterium]
MKKLSLLIFIILILTFTLWGIGATSLLSYNLKNQSFKTSSENIEATVCPGEETKIILTITVWADPSQTVNITLIPGADWIKPEQTEFSVVAPPEGYSFQTTITLSGENLSPGTYNSTLTIRYYFTASETIKEDVSSVTLNVILPYFEIIPENLTLIMKPTDTKAIDFIVRNTNGCGIVITVSPLEQSENVQFIFNPTIILYPSDVKTFRVIVKTKELKETVTIHLKFVSSFYERTVTLKICPSISVTIEGEVVEVNEDEGYIIIETFDGERFKVLLRDEDKGKYKEGDYIKVTGRTGETEDEIIPEIIEEVTCGVTISDPEDIVFCSTCPEIKYGAEEIPKENVKRIKIKAKNTGNIDAGISVKVELSEELGISEVDVKLEPESFSLKPGEEKEITITVTVKKSYKEGDYIYYKLKFDISPSPPCKKEIVKDFNVYLCPTIRTISGSVKFLNPKNNECPMKGVRVLLFLNYEPRCSVDKHFKEIEGEFHEVHQSFNAGLPDKKYYLETYTDKDGKFEFSFHDFDCKHDYILIVTFETKEFKVKYYDCKNLFFVKLRIKNEDKPCPKGRNKRDIIIGKDTDLTIPSDFTKDPKDLAQIFCHMDEAFSVFRNETCGGEKMIKDSMLPLTVCAFSNTEGTWYWDKTINIDKADSPTGSIHRPMNREWHEFGHFLHDSLYGIPERKTGDVNHGNFKNSNTTDSFLEGFAEFISMLTLKLLKDKGTCCYNLSNFDNGNYQGWEDLENNKNQPLGELFIKYKGKKVAVKHDANGIPYIKVNGRTIKPVFFSQNADGSFNIRFADGGPKSIPLQMANSYEEFAAASVLLDLVDKGSWYKGGKDDDKLSIDWKELLCFIKKEKIKDMRDLYEKLKAKYGASKIDDIFERNGFFQDKNLNRKRDVDEEIGYTYRPKIKIDGTTVGEVKKRRDFPFPENAYVIVNLMDEEEREIDEADIRIEFKTFEGTVSVVERSIKNGERVPILIPPDSNCFVVISMKDSKGKPIIITEDEFWDALLNDKSYIKEGTLIKTDKEASPEILLDTQELYLEGLLEGEKETFYLYFVNSGGGILNVSFSTSQNWIKVKPQEFEGNAGFIKVTVDTEGLSGGMNRGKVIVSGNGGEREIDVSVSVVPKVKKTVIELFIGSVTAYINGEVYTLDAAPYIKPPG